MMTHAHAKCNCATRPMPCMADGGCAPSGGQVALLALSSAHHHRRHIIMIIIFIVIMDAFDVDACTFQEQHVHG
eukprot:10433869-Karenia_brevis.AAC.1